MIKYSEEQEEKMLVFFLKQNGSASGKIEPAFR